MCTNENFLKFQRVFQGEREGKEPGRLPEAKGEAAAGGRPEGILGLDHSSRVSGAAG